MGSKVFIQKLDQQPISGVSLTGCSALGSLSLLTRTYFDVDPPNVLE